MSTTNWMDRHIVPENKTAQWLVTPVLIPVALTTLTIDNFIVAPAVHLPSAAMDTKDWLKKDVGGYYTEMGVLPIRLALAPAVFVGSELGRTAFALEPREKAAWAWPKWGLLWLRDDDGKLLGPSTEYSSDTRGGRK